MTFHLAGTEVDGDGATRLFTDLISRHAAIRGNAPAVIAPTHALSWSALEDQSSRVGAALVRSGIGTGDRVALLGAASADYIVMMIGALKAGASVVPLSTMVTEDVLGSLVDDCGARAVYADAEYCGKFDSAFPKPVLRVSGGEKLHNWAYLRDWIANADPSGKLLSRLSGNSEFNVIYSSGTTGIPKGIVHDHDHRTRQIEAFQAFGLTPDTKTVLATALYTNYSLVAMLATLGSGGAVCLLPRFEAGSFIEMCSSEGISHAFLVPVQIERILKHPEFCRLAERSDMCVFSAGSPLAADTKRALIQRWPSFLIEIYGATEGGASTILVANQHPDKLSSVGRATSGCEIRIIHEDGIEAAPGECGEIVGSSTMMMHGYLGREEESRKLIWRAPDGREFLRSGDIGYLDQDGFLFLTDRVKDIIISGGLNIFASDLEATLSAHPDVSECAVVSAPSERWGETPVAFVVLSQADVRNEEHIMEWVNARLSKHQRISEMIVCEALPRNMMGKIMKQELRARVRKQPV